MHVDADVGSRGPARSSRRMSPSCRLETPVAVIQAFEEAACAACESNALGLNRRCLQATPSMTFRAVDQWDAFGHTWAVLHPASIVDEEKQRFRSDNADPARKAIRLRRHSPNRVTERASILASPVSRFGAVIRVRRPLQIILTPVRRSGPEPPVSRGRRG